LLRDGLRFDELNQRLEALSKQLEELMQAPSHPSAASASSIADRLESAIELAQLKEHSLFALTAKPWPDARFNTLFAGNDASLVRNFNNPPKLRRAGFSIEHDGNSRIVSGELRRSVIPGWKILELWRDGFLLYAVDALVHPFWGSPRQDGCFRLNPLALAEPVYLFSELTRLVYAESLQKPRRVEYRLRFERIGEEGKPASLSDGELDPVYFESGSRHHAPALNMETAITIAWTDTIEAGAIAYKIVQEVYHWFGISDDGIPYTITDADGGKRIDPAALIKAGARPAALIAPN
jgi:hypothetical protein